MKEFKYIIQKLDNLFNVELSFSKTKTQFNKLYNEFLELQMDSDEVCNLLMPLERVFLYNI